MADLTAGRFGQGVLSRAAALVYSLLVVELLLVATTLPGLVPLVLLARDASNIPLFAACALPLGPAVAAALYALHHHRADLADLTPAAAFWRGYRLNLKPVLRVWAPLLLWLAVVAVNLAHLDAAAVPRWWAALLVVLAVAAALWGTNLLVITALFDFRVRDAARLASYFLVRRPAVTLGNLSVLVAAAGLTVLLSEAVLTLSGSLLVYVLLRNCRPLVGQISREFIA
ncbi:DUF624 domain-containing protein [Catellatospora chokoriensis]|uniref:DUF624 domain-containing protein n=1 Tax=Catellatospora chokoriensis TaxID=310353 RepID=A0A8J3K8C9_9ACTN|nr:DUF624 domain-containing protein [Catellatospora chokoriensis]GIF91339.1 hypothetical protein Cch02nite_47830 [Catellatospora chokoriensis]